MVKRELEQAGLLRIETEALQVLNECDRAECAECEKRLADRAGLTPEGALIVFLALTRRQIIEKRPSPAGETYVLNTDAKRWLAQDAVPLTIARFARRLEDRIYSPGRVRRK
jgi:hypothetical protein